MWLSRGFEEELQDMYEGDYSDLLSKSIINVKSALDALFGRHYDDVSEGDTSKSPKLEVVYFEFALVTVT
jgi:hypothetical protein